MNNSNNCETITKMNQESQNQRLRFFAKVDISTKLKILDKQKELFHKLKSVHSDVNNTEVKKYASDIKQLFEPVEKKDMIYPATINKLINA